MAKPLAPELEAGLRRLKLRRVRELAPELLQTARTQRWPPEELLAVVVGEEIAARESLQSRAARVRGAAARPQDARGLRPGRLYRGLADNTIGRLIPGLLRNDLVIIDDLGFTCHVIRLAGESFRLREARSVLTPA